MKKEEPVTIIVPKIIIWPAVVMLVALFSLTFLAGIAHGMGW